MPTPATEASISADPYILWTLVTPGPVQLEVPPKLFGVGVPDKNPKFVTQIVLDPLAVKTGKGFTVIVVVAPVEAISLAQLFLNYKKPKIFLSIWNGHYQQLLNLCPGSIHK